MNLIKRYLLRRERLLRVLRGFRARQRLQPVANRTAKINPGDILAFSTVRNERIRLPYFLKYYRKLGVRHFFFVDNGSDDGTGKYLETQPDCSIWFTNESYKRAKFGVDWLNGLKRKYALGHWILAVDVDEFLIYPHIDKRPLKALTDWLDARHIHSFGTILLDMYSQDPLADTPYREGDDPFASLLYFDSGNYVMNHNPRYGNLWIQGGVRQRIFFPDNPYNSPALNKIPLVKWQKGVVYISSTHSLLPRAFNVVYAENGGERVSGCLLHAKFLNHFVEKAAEETTRAQHYKASREYRAYLENLQGQVSLWTEHSERFQDWEQLEDLGLMSRGSWA